MSPFPNKEGRPPVGPQHSVRCSPREWAAVERLAETTRISRSAMARQLIVLGLRSLADPEGGHRADRD